MRLEVEVNDKDVRLRDQDEAVLLLHYDHRVKAIRNHMWGVVGHIIEDMITDGLNEKQQ